MALDSLSAIACFTEGSHALLERGAIKTLLQYIVRESALLQRDGNKMRCVCLSEAISALSNIAGEDETTRMATLDAGSHLVLFCSVLIPFQNVAILVRLSIWALSNLCRGDGFPQIGVR